MRGSKGGSNIVVNRIRPAANSWQSKAFAFVPMIVACALLIILPIFMPNFVQSLMIKFLIYSIFGISMNLIYGYTGLFSMGQAAFFGVGGYTAGMIYFSFGIDNFWIIFFATILVSAIVAAIFGFISLRVSGLYFLMVTLALGMLLYSIFYQGDPNVTGGPYGLRGVPWLDPVIPGITVGPQESLRNYFFVLFFCAISYFIKRLIVNSAFGKALQGIREDEVRMEALGYNTWLYKYICFIISGVFAGIAGMFMAEWNSLAHPQFLSLRQSTYAVLIVLLGGAGTLYGPIVGSGVLVGLEYGGQMISPERWPIMIGALFIISALFLRRTGILPRLNSAWEKVRAKTVHGSIESRKPV